MRHIRNVDRKPPTGGKLFHVNGIIIIFRGSRIDGENVTITPIFAVFNLSRISFFAKGLRLGENGNGEILRHSVLVNDLHHIDALLTRES